MKTRLSLLVAVSVAFVVALGIVPTAPAYAAATCSLSPVVCANDSSPGCETICAGDDQAVCTEGSCTPAGNIASPNRCECK